MEKVIYAVYKGDKFLCEGTASECAKYLKVEPKTVRLWSAPSNLKRSESSGGNNRKIAFVIDKLEK